MNKKQIIEFLKNRGYNKIYEAPNFLKKTHKNIRLYFYIKDEFNFEMQINILSKINDRDCFDIKTIGVLSDIYEKIEYIEQKMLLMANAFFESEN